MSIKAISLISGGLDSTLATRVILDQGVEVIAANFVSPFCTCDRGHAVHASGPGEDRPYGCRHEAQYVSQQFGIPLKIVNTTKDFLEMLKRPKHGYGSHINPCIDCRILMLKKARELMTEEGAQFLVTGEVLGQRPMSQRRDAMRTIEKEAGVLGLVLRPLSAKLLEPTIPEEKGWVDRQKLLDISGRSRKVQMQLALDFDIKDYPCPAGGCLLTDPGFSRRVKDLIDHDLLTLEQVNLLKHGRHFRLSDTAKIVVGRDKKDNEALEAMAKDGDVLLMPQEEAPGATGLVQGDLSNPAILDSALRIVARYFDQARTASTVRVEIRRRGSTDVVEVEPVSDEETRKYLI